MLTIKEYAEQRGCAPKTVYNALKKHQLKTVDGVSNGKAAQFLDDETIEQLNQIIRTSPQELSILKQQLEIRTADYQLALEANKEVMRAKDELAYEKDKTRKQLLDEVVRIEDNFSRDLISIRSDFNQQLENKEAEIRKLNNELSTISKENESLRAQVKKLKELLNWSQEHPIKNAWKHRKGKNNASAKSNQNTSNTDS